MGSEPRALPSGGEGEGHGHGLRADPLAAPEFQRAVSTALGAWGCAAEPTAPFVIAVTRGTEPALRVRLDGLYKAYRHAELEVSDAAAEIAAAAGAPDTGVAVGGPLPLLVRRDGPLLPGSIIRPCFDAALAITYARTLPHGDLPLAIEEVAARWPYVDDLHALALANLERATVGAEVQVQGAGAGMSLGFATGDGLDAARALLPAQMRELAGWLRGAVVALPARDLLLMFGTADAGYVAEARAHVQAMYAGSPAPLSRGLYAVSATGELTPTDWP